jgi:hypothetical protein
MTEQEACAAIVRWAKRYYSPEIDDPTPDVNVVSITHDANEDEWIAELEVSSCADNPFVTFWLEENRLHIENIEY